MATLAFTPLTGGRSAKAPVLLVHGFASTPYHNWVSTGWVKTLEAASYPLHLVTLPYHRLQSVEDESLRPATLLDISWADHQDAVAQLSEVLKTYTEGLGQPAHLIGFSIGARVLWGFAATFPHLALTLTLGAMPVNSRLDQVHSSLLGEIDVPEGFDSVLACSPIAPESLVSFTSAHFPAVDPEIIPQCPVFMYEGCKDSLAHSRSAFNLLSTRQANWLEIAGRDHINILTSGQVRKETVRFLDEHR